MGKSKGMLLEALSPRPLEPCRIIPAILCDNLNPLNKTNYI